MWYNISVAQHHRLQQEKLHLPSSFFCSKEWGIVPSNNSPSRISWTSFLHYPSTLLEKLIISSAHFWISYALFICTVCVQSSLLRLVIFTKFSSLSLGSPPQLYLTSRKSFLQADLTHLTDFRNSKISLRVRVEPELQNRARSAVLPGRRGSSIHSMDGLYPLVMTFMISSLAI